MRLNNAISTIVSSIALFLLMFLKLFGQQNEFICIAPQGFSLQSVSSAPLAVGAGNYAGLRSWYILPIEFIIVGPSDPHMCDSLVDSFEYTIRHDILPELKHQFGPHRICFRLVRIGKICSTAAYSKTYGVLPYEIRAQADSLGYDPNVLTVFIVPDLAQNATGAASGRGKLPAITFIRAYAIRRDDRKNIKVTSHEIGHLLGLWHSDVAPCDERNDWEWAWTLSFDPQLRYQVSHGRCAQTGDEVCDTWPGVARHHEIDYKTCHWKGPDTVCPRLRNRLTHPVIRHFVDSIWYLYTLDSAECTPHLLCNTMAYVPGIYCRKGFTPGQGARMRWFLDHAAVGQLLRTVPSNLPTRYVSGVYFPSGTMDTFYHSFHIQAQNVTVDAGAKVEMSAGYRVTLKPPFHAKAGSSFHAYIDRKCPGPSIHLPVIHLLKTAAVDSSTDLESDGADLLQSAWTIYPSVVSAGSPVALSHLPGQGRLWAYWVAPTGQTLPIVQDLPLGPSTLYLPTPTTPGLYRLLTVVQTDGFGQRHQRTFSVVVY